MSENNERVYIFRREQGFYPVRLRPEWLKKNIEANPGTLSVEDALLDVVWTYVDGFLDKALEAKQL